MPTRVMAFLLSLVLLWSHLGAIESPLAFTPSWPEQPQTAHASALPPVPEGSVEHHHLDDLPSQAQGDPPTETPALLPAPSVLVRPFLVTDPPRRWVASGAASPFLAGPLRPPCGTALAG